MTGEGGGGRGVRARASIWGASTCYLCAAHKLREREVELTQTAGVLEVATAGRMGSRD